MSILPSVITNLHYSHEFRTFCETRNIPYCHRYYDNKNPSDGLFELTNLNINETLRYMESTSKFSTLSQYSSKVVNHSLINMITMLVLLVISCFIISVVNNEIREADYGNTTPSDFVLMISEVPKNFMDIKHLKEILTVVSDIYINIRMISPQTN